MAMMNRKLDPDLETLFMMPTEQYTYVSSRLIKGVFKLGGDVTRAGAAAGDGADEGQRDGEDLGWRTLTLQEQFGQIDIYLFDQILRGNIAPGMRLVDAGCGGGRNLIYLLREGYEVFGVDADAELRWRRCGSWRAGWRRGCQVRTSRWRRLRRCRFRMRLRMWWSAIRCCILRGTRRIWMRWCANFGGCCGRAGCCSAGWHRRSGPGRGWRSRRWAGGGYRMSHGPEWLLVDEAMLMELTRGAGRGTGGSAEDDGGAGAAVHDDLGGAKKAASGAEGHSFASSGMPARRS